MTIYKPHPKLSADVYRIGSDGSLWSRQKCGRGAGRLGDWRRLKDHPKGKGYRKFRIGIEGTAVEFYVHHAVLETFVGPCPEGMECRHLDGNKANNHLDNLCWGTREENVDDKFRHGTQPMGSRIPWSKLDEKDIPAIRDRLAVGERQAEIAADYGVDPETIGDIKRQKTWNHV